MPMHVSHPPISHRLALHIAAAGSRMKFRGLAAARVRSLISTRALAGLWPARPTLSAEGWGPELGSLATLRLSSRNGACFRIGYDLKSGRYPIAIGCSRFRFRVVGGLGLSRVSQSRTAGTSW